MIIDTHVHIGDQFTFCMTEEMVTEAMEKYNFYMIYHHVDQYN